MGVWGFFCGADVLGGGCESSGSRCLSPPKRRRRLELPLGCAGPQRVVVAFVAACGERRAGRMRCNGRRRWRVFCALAARAAPSGTCTKAWLSVSCAAVGTATPQRVNMQSPCLLSHNLISSPTHPTPYTPSRAPRPSALLLQLKPRRVVRQARVVQLTQADLLAEAAKTEIENTRSLQVGSQAMWCVATGMCCECGSYGVAGWCNWWLCSCVIGWVGGAAWLCV